MSVQYNDYIKTEAWRQRAEAAKARAGHRCQICNRAAPRVTLAVHHRTFERLGQEQPEDLTVLCRGCYELYEKNRRMPTPAAQSTPTTAKTDKPVKPRRPSLAATPSQRFFTPVRTGQQLAEENGHNGHQEEPIVLLTVDQIYTLETGKQPAAEVEIFALSPAQANSSAAALYQLAGEPTPQPSSQPDTVQPIGVQLMGLLLLVCFVLLGIFAFNDFAPPGVALLPSGAATTSVTAPEEKSAPALGNAVTTPPVAVVTPTVAPTIAPTMTPLPPTMTPTVPSPTPTNLPPTVAPTPTVPPTTVAPAPQSSVIRTALVCQNPCSCAPIVRTIPQGTAVTVLQTQLCGGDVWSQIGEGEWLGPGMVDTP